MNEMSPKALLYPYSKKIIKKLCYLPAEYRFIFLLFDLIILLSPNSSILQKDVALGQLTLAIQYLYLIFRNMLIHDHYTNMF